MTKEVHTPYDISLWKSIRVLWPFMKNRTTVKVGNGYKTSFWEDKWSGSESLKGLFPEMFGLAVQQNMSLANIWTQQGWNIQFRRNFNDWQIDTVTKFFRVLEGLYK